QSVVHSTRAWLQSSWHIQVPFAWLEACVEWLQDEAGGAGRLSQQQVNQQVLDQWLLTDLRDLSYPVLPEGLSQAQKTELRGTFCVQVDSLLDISQPAYSQMQKWRGSDCANDEVSAVTQFTQRPWEARPSRMLLLQVTDGVQSLEAMEYRPVPALSTALRPGVKLQLQGQMVCRLGMLLLGPPNIKVLGGEVEDLVERNNQGKVLCRTLGLPEEQQERGEAQPAALQDSGYGTLSETSTQPSRSCSIRSFVSTDSSSEQEDPDLSIRRQVFDHDMPLEDFPDEDFDNLPLDELDSVIFQLSVQQGPSRDRESFPHKTDTSCSSHTLTGNSSRSATESFPFESSRNSPRGQNRNPDGAESVQMGRQSDSSVPALTLTSPPFTYLCLLEEMTSKPQPHTREIRVKAFIVTLVGKLSGNNGLWRIRATISDGTGYLDVELSDGVLTGLLGFSVAGKASLKRDPARRGELDGGMRRCQEELVDMCCVMTIAFEPDGGRAVVTRAEPVSEKVFQELQQRLKDDRK
uniref:RecQ-mediated genome instability protein 1 n=1 Tax=Gasterosteus aculeatus TaxID=69293 RepID=G3NXN3_GASAC